MIHLVREIGENFKCSDGRTASELTEKLLSKEKMPGVHSNDLGGYGYNPAHSLASHPFWPVLYI